VAVVQLIPVIDIKNNQVVHAVKGQRMLYQPLHSPLASSSNPFIVINCLLDLARFTCFYIADLDAIMTRCTGHIELLIAILEKYPDIAFWIDRGYPIIPELAQYPNFTPVIGSESLHKSQLSVLPKQENAWILSLDHGLKGRLGPDALFENPGYWPKSIIVMTLAKVGSGTGPDFQKIQHYQKISPHKQFIAAGGIRNIKDIRNLEKKGIRKVLLASALHNGAIGKSEIAQLPTQSLPTLPFRQGSEKP